MQLKYRSSSNASARGTTRTEQAATMPPWRRQCATERSHHRGSLVPADVGALPKLQAATSVTSTPSAAMRSRSEGDAASHRTRSTGARSRRSASAEKYRGSGNPRTHKSTSVFSAGGLLVASEPKSHTRSAPWRRSIQTRSVSNARKRAACCVDLSCAFATRSAMGSMARTG